jgi:hypothetical protein
MQAIGYERPALEWQERRVMEQSFNEALGEAMVRMTEAMSADATLAERITSE